MIRAYSFLRRFPLLLLAVALAFFIALDTPLSVQAQESTNANLSALTVSGSDSATGTFTAFGLSPAFSAGTTSYTATVANTVTHVKLTPTVEDTGKAEVWAGRSGSLKPVTDGTASDAYGLVEGANAFIARVWAEDQNVVKDYRLTVSRTPASRSIDSPVSVIVREGGPKKTVTVTLSQAVSREAIVRLKWSSNMWEDVHVDPASGSYPITIPRNQKTFQFALTPVDDSLREGTETYSLPIAIDADRDGSFDDVTGTIDIVVEDNEDAPVFRLEASSTTVTEGDSVRVRVIDYPELTAVESTGTAKLGTPGFTPEADFSMNPDGKYSVCPSDPNASCDPPRNVHWGLPDDQGWITVGTVPDGVREGEETIVLTAFNQLDPDQKTEPITIRLRDLEPTRLNLNPSSRDLRRNGGAVTVSLTLDRPSPETTSIRIVPSGTASVLPLGENQADYDYEMVPSQKTVTFPPASETQVEAFIRIEKGETQGKSELTLTALNDATPGQTITLTASSGAYRQRFASGSTTITIREPLPPAPKLIGLTASNIDSRGRFIALPLTPSTFSQSTTDYTAAVASTVTHVKLTPTVEERYKWTATLQVGLQGGNLRRVTSGTISHSIPLYKEVNPITVRVTLGDGSNSTDYTVTVTRPPTMNSPGNSQQVSGTGQPSGDSGQQLGGSSGDEGVVPQGQSPQQQVVGRDGSPGSQGDEGVAGQGQAPPQSQQQQAPSTNRAPTVSGSIADVSGLEEGATREISLSGVFSDADGDALTITASSDYETVATVSVASDGSALSVAGVSAGTATITVTARDPNGNSATDDFGVTVTDPAPQGQEQQQPPAQQPQQVTATTTTTTEPEEQETEVEETETEAESPDAASRYDADGDGFISQPELRQALDDYYAAKITYSEMLQVYKAYRSSR